MASATQKKKPKALDDIPTSLRDACAASLLNILKSIDGEKDLVLDAELITCLEYIVKPQQLKACGIQKLFKLESGSSPGRSSRCVYLVKSRVENTRIVADHVKANSLPENQKNFYIVFVPRRLYSCDLLLESEGVYGLVEMLEYPLSLIPVDSDLLSLELTEFFTSYFVAKDQTHLYNIALSIVHLQKICGPVQNIQGHGRCAGMVIDLMKTLMDGEESLQNSCSSIDLMIFDRDIDYVSVLLSQLNYEGLLDETFDIKSGRVSFGKAVTGQDNVLKLTLDDEDPIFSVIRNCHFTSVLEVLKNKAKELQVNHNDPNDLTIEDMQKIVTQKKNTAQEEKLLFVYMNTCEVIIKQKNDDNFQEQLTVESNMIEGVGLKETVAYIEEVINRQAPVTKSLRLMCLLSLTQDGLSSKDYNSLSVQFLQSYGHKHMITLHNLKKLGLFIEQIPSYKPLQTTNPSGAAATKLAGKVVAAVASFPRQSSFRAISRKMFLVPDASVQVNLKNPTDTSYVFGGAYTPLIAKLTEEAITNENFNKYEEVLKLLPGLTIHNKPLYPGTVSTAKRTVLVYFIGGATYAEIAALRLIGKLKSVKIVIATTAIINGNSMTQLLMPKTE